MKRVYLAGPIAGCTDREAGEWRYRATLWLAKTGIETLDPMRRDYREERITPSLSQQIVQDDKADILQSDVVLVNYWKPSTGTAMEILYAHEVGVPVISVVPSYDSLSPWIRAHSRSVYIYEYAALNEVIELCAT